MQVRKAFSNHVACLVHERRVLIGGRRRHFANLSSLKCRRQEREKARLLDHFYISAVDVSAIRNYILISSGYLFANTSTYFKQLRLS